VFPHDAEEIASGDGEASVRIGVVLSPTGDWPGILAAAELADRRGLDAVGFYDHHHAERPEWGYVCGWAAYGAVAQASRRIHLVPMVLCQPHHPLGGLAKESSILSLISGGRFELGIGAGERTIAMAPQEVPGGDHIIIGKDPQGAEFALVGKA
jgi:alkanesulfonate monooxygenase SsuD/methylene tetrahydromethanopterin reductase-like flavin-dependent oxidoreductase (luciferase family)